VKSLRSIRSFGLLCAAVAVVAGTVTVLPIAALPAQAHVALEDPAPAVTDYTQNLRYGVSLTALGEGGQASSGLPIPIGLTPITLTGTLTAAVASDGVAIISVGTAQIEVPVQPDGAFELPLPAGTVVDDAVILSVKNRLNPLRDELCSYDTTTAVTLSNIRIVASGFETPPATVAQFFTPSVRNITVVIADPQNPLVNEAALAAVGALSYKYGRDTVITAAVASDFVPVPLPGSRVIIITANSETRTTLTVSDPDVPTLTLSGPADALTEAAAALGSSTLGLAGAPTVTDLAQTSTAPPGTVFTLAALGAAQPTLAGVGLLTYSTIVSQSRFGGPMSAFALHIEGGNTPTPPGGIVRASVLWNDLIVDSQSIANTDTYNVDIAIDSSLVKRDNTLTIRLEAVPPGGYCTTAPLPAELDINGTGSTITGTPGQSLLAGFERFPQVLGDSLPIAFGAGDVTAGSLIAAAHLVSALQRASAIQLTVSLVDLADFERQNYPGLVVGATPADAEALKAPLRFEPWRAVDASGKNFTVTVDGPFAALEAFDASGRDIALLGSTSPATEGAPLMDTLVVQADADPFGWFPLIGDLLVAQKNLPILALSTATIVPQPSVATEFTVPLWLIIAAAVLLIIVAARLIALGRRRQRIVNNDNP